VENSIENQNKKCYNNCMSKQDKIHISDIYKRISSVHECDIDHHDRRIFLMTDIDSSSAEVTIKNIRLLESIDPTGEITILLSTYGGDPYAGFAIYDTMRSCTCPVKVVGSGAVMSAGILIIAGGDKGSRFADENCQFMYHAGSTAYDGEYNNSIITAEHAKYFSKITVDAVTSRTKKRRAFWDTLEKKGTDTYFGSKEAKRYGLIDHIRKSYG
jgi:ATP-dependent Clp protease protease subunit